MQISVIIPTYNEEQNVGRLVTFLQKHRTSVLAEILVVDGGSSDNTIEVARQAGACTTVCPRKGRAHQMNEGAKRARGEVLYFIHADTVPPASFLQDIVQTVQEGSKIGCFRLRFASDSPLLKINGYCSRFGRLMCRGGDQTLFVVKDFFEGMQGYDEYYVIMEEYDLIRRACLQTDFVVLPQEVEVSARKYEQNSYLRVNLANFIVFTMFRCGVQPIHLKKTYQRLLNYRI